ncbi:hypothetical protein [Haloarcula sp. CBA1127]|uniref:hypothetical protein n=1 Tax=Haloarcula sp. CBA1127 TaxID=1765055 RepID=UPI00073EDC19|nr:hypothetical protein [Haloarcula sp. CBA1127]
MLATLLQIRTGWTDTGIALAVIALSLVTVALSAAIAVVLIRGYRRGPGRTGMLTLAVGLLLLTTVPETLRIVLPTATAVGTVGRSLLVSACELSGLGTILWTVYGGESS